MSTDLYNVQYSRVEERDELRVEGVKKKESNIIEISQHGQLPFSPLKSRAHRACLHRNAVPFSFSFQLSLSSLTHVRLHQHIHQYSS